MLPSARRVTGEVKLTITVCCCMLAARCGVAK